MLRRCLVGPDKIGEEITGYLEGEMLVLREDVSDILRLNIVGRKLGNCCWLLVYGGFGVCQAQWPLGLLILLLKHLWFYGGGVLLDPSQVLGLVRVRFNGSKIDEMR
jgi:hypothetical protein